MEVGVDDCSVDCGIDPGYNKSLGTENIFPFRNKKNALVKDRIVCSPFTGVGAVQTSNNIMAGINRFHCNESLLYTRKKP